MPCLGHASTVCSVSCVHAMCKFNVASFWGRLPVHRYRPHGPLHRMRRQAEEQLHAWMEQGQHEAAAAVALQLAATALDAIVYLQVVHTLFVFYNFTRGEALHVPGTT